MEALTKLLDWVWNLKIFKGHRTKISQWGLGATALMTAYQGVAIDPALIAKGTDFPDLPSGVMFWVGVLAVYLAKKVKQFADEHK